MIAADIFKSLALQSSDLVINTRQWLHQHPELSFQEKQTSAYIAQKLSEWNIPFKNNIGGYGIVSWIEGKQPGNKIALRADMDALPIQEQTNLPYTSIYDGIMHACGHDAHTSLLLVALYILQQLKNEFNGTIYGIFQPAEEKIPGGAIAMLNDSFFNNLTFDAVVALHVSPEIPCGKIGLKAGPYMASTDEIYITVKGKGGHAAMPHHINDTVLVASQIIVNLQSIVSRLSNPNIPTVLSFGKFIANGATNIIPDEVSIEGTFRTFDEQWRKEALPLIQHICLHTALSMNVKAEVKTLNGYPVLVNDANLTEKIQRFAGEFLESKNIIMLDHRTTAEDFAYFSQRFPSVLFRLGTGGENDCSFPLHSSKFNVNEHVFHFGHGLLSFMAYKLTF